LSGTTLPARPEEGALEVAPPLAILERLRIIDAALRLGRRLPLDGRALGLVWVAGALLGRSPLGARAAFLLSGMSSSSMHFSRRAPVSAA
jgi:hypothetical protein